MRQQKTTKEQIEEIRLHKDDTGRSQLARRLGMKRSTLSYWCERLGGRDLTHYSNGHNPETDLKVKELYKRYSAGEIAEMLGMNRQNVKNAVKRTGAKHDDETEERLYWKQRDINSRMTKEAIAERGKRLHRVWIMEKFRTLSGQKQKTNLRLRKMSKKLTQAIWSLKRTYGYVSDDMEPKTLVYCDRRTKNESHFTQKYGITFISPYEYQQRKNTQNTA